MNAPAERPSSSLIDRILELSQQEGVQHADVRLTRTRHGSISLRDTDLESLEDSERSGIGLRVVVDGAWGFAAVGGWALDDPAGLVNRAIGLARLARRLHTSPVELAPEPVHVGSWTQPADIDPFDVSVADRIGLITERSMRLLAAESVDHVDAFVQYVREETLYADLSGTRTDQSRYRIAAEWSATAIDPRTGSFDSLRTIAPPAGRGWEYVTGDAVTAGAARAWHWDDELAQLPDHLAERMQAPSVQPGEYSLVLDPTNLWLTIHESVGHATELDRALGYEANYAGTTFVRPTDLHSLEYGSALMNVVADRTTPYGLATVGWDDEGVTAQRWPLIEHGILTGMQTDRAIAAEMDLGRSNGCAYADSAEHAAISRMPNVSLLAQPDGPTTEQLIAGVDDGLYIVGDRSWSIDMQRYNFQFTGQRFYQIRGGRLLGQVKDVAYQASTPDFWKSMIAVGGPDTELLCGALNCGKGQPGQVAPVSHSCPTAVFENIRVLNTAAEGM